MRLLTLLVFLLAVAGCGASGSACEAAVREAADISAMEDTVSDLDRAIAECATVSELAAAAAQFPDAFDGVDVREFASNRCAFEASLADSAICAEIGE